MIVSNMNEHGVLELDELTQGTVTRGRTDERIGCELRFVSADTANQIRSSQSLLEDEWEPEPIEALTGE